MPDEWETRWKTLPRKDRLSWGKHYLMCPPTYFGVEYSINPWMDPDRRVDADRAMLQWLAFHDALVEAGANVRVLEPHPGVPDLVFTANAGLVHGERFVATNFRHAERQAEQPFNIGWFRREGFAIERLPAAVVQEGAGDALPFGEALITGFGQRSERRSYETLADGLGVNTVAVELVDPRLYHLDIVFSPIDNRRALIAPEGMTRRSARILAQLIPEPIVLSLEEALAFAANSVVVGDTVFMPHVPRHVGRTLEKAGFEVVELDMSEFKKAGGACRCLTLALDVVLPLRLPTRSLVYA